MRAEFIPIFLFVLVAIGTAIGMLVASAILGPNKSTRVKEMPYESGMDPIGDARQRFDVRYYLVAIVFLLFDVELLFLYPWAAGQWSRPAAVAGAAEATVAATTASAGIPAEFRNMVFLEILVFVIVLAAAYVYAWRKGVFEWR
jgi:NADH-quinone oxidoreductase subunit A